MSVCLIKIKLFLLLVIIPAYLFSQQTEENSRDTTGHPLDSSKTKEKNTSGKTEKPRIDTVKLFNADPMYVNVLKITSDSIIYTEPGETNLKKLDKQRVHKIRYEWGRVETVNESPPKYPERYDWRKVEILENKKKTQGLFEIENIQAKAKGSPRGFDTPKSIELRARAILKKKAANVNAQYVLITNKIITIAFGEMPSATLKGIAYSKENPQNANDQETK